MFAGCKWLANKRFVFGKPIGLIAALALILSSLALPAEAQSQISQTRTITAINNGYCFFDIDNNGVFDANDYPLTDPVINNNDVLVKDTITYTGTDSENVTTTNILNQGVLHRPDVLGALAAGQNYNINITNICVGETSRTDTIVTVTDDDDAVDSNGDGNPANDPDTSTTTTQTGTSDDTAIYDDDGFTFGGNSVIDFTGQLLGNVEFDSTITDANGTAFDDDVTFTLGDGSEIAGNLDFGTGGSSNVEVSDAVITLNGEVTGVGLAGASNIELTNNAEISGSLTAGNISEGLDLTNTAAIGTLDISGSDTVNASLTSTSAIGTLTASNLGDAASVLTNAGTVSILRALNNPSLSITNSGTVSAPVDGAVILGGVDIVFNNTGTLNAASGGTVDLSAVTGTAQFNSSGTVSASTTDIVLAGGATGNINIINTGTMSTTNSRGLTLTDIGGAVSFINGTDTVPGGAVSSGAGRLSAFDTAVNVSDSEALGNAASQAMQATIRQDSASSRIEVTAEHAILADNVAALTLVNQGLISAGTNNAVQADNAGSVTIENNGASARISAGDQSAIRAPGLSGEFSLTNAGLVESRNATLFLDDAQGAISLTNSGTLRATHQADSAGFDHDDDPLSAALDDFVVQATRAAGATGGAVTVSNESNGTISINSSNALRLSDFSATNDTVTLTNAGSVTAGALYALRLDDIRALTLTNSGTMTAANEVMTATDLAGAVTLTNSGTLRATHALDAADATTNFAVNLTGNAGDDGGAVSLTNSGTIAIASDNAIRLSGFNRDDDAVTLNNSGQITAGRDAAVSLAASKAVTISNSGETAQITATGDRAVDIAAIDGALSLTNSGTISAANETFDAQAIAGAVTLTNSGTLRATHALADADATTNFALRLARLDGAAGGAVAMTNSGTISVNSDNAVLLSGFDETADSVTVTASGTMSAGRDNALLIDSVNDLALTNSGTISAGRNNAFSVISANSLTLSNSGENAAITALGDDAVNLGTVNGVLSLTNGGSISAADRAVTIGTLTGNATITNSGTIGVTAADAEYALSITNASAAVSLTNSGTISATADRAINLQSVTGDLTISNTGSLTAAGQYGLRGGTVVGNVSIANSGTLTAATNAVHTDAPGGNFTLLNSGTLTTSGAASSYLVSATNVTGTVSLTNSGTASVAGGTVMDLRNAGGTVTIDNSGTISSLGGRVFDIRNAGGAITFGNSATLSATTAPIVDANAAAAGFTFDNSGALSGSSMLVDARIAGGAVSLTNGGNITSTGTFALRADAAPATVSVNNSGTIAAQATALSLSGATGAVGIINSGTLRATAATALDASNGGAVTLSNSGTITAASNAALFSDATALQVTNAANASMTASAGHALVADNIDNATLTNNGTISATGGTAISMTGDGVEIVNSGTISGNSVGISVGSDAEIVNLGTINVGTANVAVQFAGTGSVLQLSQDAKLIGRLVAPAIAEEADRHELVINLDAGLSYYYDFDGAGIKFTDNQGGDRPQAVGSAHGASASLARAQDLLLARRAISLVRGYHESSPLYDNRQLNAVAWRGDSVQEASATEAYHLRDKSAGWMGTTLLGALPKRRLQFLVAQDRVDAAVNLDMQKFKSDYVGFGLAARTLASYQGIYLSAFGLMGVSSNETQRRMITNMRASGELTTSASYYSAHLDTHMSLNYALRLTRGLQMDVRVGLGLSGVQQESHDEGDYYRHDGHLLMQGLLDSNLRLSYDWNEGYLPSREVAFLDFSAGYRGVLAGDTRDFRFLDANVTQGADARFTDSERGEALFRIGLGFERTMMRGLVLSISAARSGHATGFESDDVSAGLRWRF